MDVGFKASRQFINHVKSRYDEKKHVLNYLFTYGRGGGALLEEG